MNNFTLAVAIPAYDCADSIASTVKSLVQQSRPPEEILVVPNGSFEGNRAIVEALGSVTELRPVSALPADNVNFRYEKPYACYLGDVAGACLLVLCKRWGNKADALNVAAAYCSSDYLVTIDADTILLRSCLRELIRPAEPGRRVVAVGGSVYPIVNKVTLLSALQVLEYERTFLIARRIYDFLDSVVLMSGALSLFRWDYLVSVGGFRTNTVGEDMEISVRMLHLCSLRKLDYRLTYAPAAVCLTEVPGEIKQLFRQRMRWQIGLLEVLYLHRKMLLRPRYGLRGMVVLPYLLLFELLSPITQLLGTAVIWFLLWRGVLYPAGVLIPLGVYHLLQQLLLQVVYKLHTQKFRKKPNRRTRAAVVLLGIAEALIYRPILSLAKLMALIRYPKLKGKWMTRGAEKHK